MRSVKKACATALLLLASWSALSAPTETSSPHCEILFGRVITPAFSNGGAPEMLEGQRYLVENTRTGLSVFDLLTARQRTIPTDGMPVNYAATPHGILSLIYSDGAASLKLIRPDLPPDSGGVTTISQGQGGLIPAYQPGMKHASLFQETSAGTDLWDTRAHDASGRFISYLDKLRTIRVLDMQKNQTRSIELPEVVTEAVLLPNSWKMLLSGQKGKLLTADLQTGKVTLLTPEVPTPDEKKIFRVSQDEKTVLQRIGGGGEESKRVHSKLLLVDLEKGTRSLHKIPSSEILPSPDGKSIVYLKDDGGNPIFRDLITGKEWEFKPYFSSRLREVKFSKDSKKLAFVESAAEQGQRMTMIDLQSRKETRLLMERPDSFVDHFQFAGPEQDLFISTANRDRQLKVIRWNPDSGKTENIDVSMLADHGRRNFVTDDGKHLIQPDFLGPPKIIELRTLKELPIAKAGRPRPQSVAEAIAKNDFILRRDHELILPFFETRAYEKNPELTLPLLLEILEESPLSFQSIFLRFPDAMARVSPDPKVALKGLSKTQRGRYLSIARRHLKERMNIYRPDVASQLSNWSEFKPLKAILSDLPLEEKEKFSDMIADSLRVGASKREFENIFASKLYKFIHEETKDWFGLPKKQISDLVIVRDEESVQLKILGTEAIDGDPMTKTAYGFYIKELPEISVLDKISPQTRILEENPQWQVGGKKFSAKASVKTMDRSLSDLVPPAKAPPYEELFRDGKLVGLVMTGDNLQDDAASVLDEYIHYYRSAGFTFEKQDIPVTDMKKVLQGMIEKNQLDYLIKEAHSDGMERDLFRFFTHGSLKKATRPRPDGKTEEMYLFIPKPDPKKTVLISNDEFGKWIRQRESSPDGSAMVYFNTSCWGTTKACNELEAASSPKLMVIAPSNTADTFLSSPTSALQQMLNAFREGKDFEGLRTAMRKDPTYVNGSANAYRFPDEPEFDTEIRKKILRPLEIKIEVFDADGKPYHLDEIDD